MQTWPSKSSPHNRKLAPLPHIGHSHVVGQLIHVLATARPGPHLVVVHAVVWVHLGQHQIVGVLLGMGMIVLVRVMGELRCFVLLVSVLLHEGRLVSLLRMHLRAWRVNEVLTVLNHARRCRLL